MFNEEIYEILNRTEDSENESDLKELNVETMSNIVIGSSDWTVEAIINQIKSGNIDLDPSYQRREAWNKDRKSKYIESLILGLPVPQIVLAEKQNKKGKFYVIDGKQRLLSLLTFFSKDDPDLSEYKNYNLKGLSIRKDLNGKNISIFKSDINYDDDYTSLQNAPIRTLLIKNWGNEDVLYEIFYRLNTGSVPLSPQELRKALKPGLFVDFAEDKASKLEGIMKILGLDKPDYRMRDVELVIRYFANKLFINSYTGDLKKFMDKTCEKLNSVFETEEDKLLNLIEELDSAISATYDIFLENDAFRKYKNGKFENRFNKPIFDIMVYYFSNQEIREKSLARSAEIKKAFIALCGDSSFLESLEHSTKNLEPTARRFNMWGSALSQIVDVSIPEIIFDRDVG